MQRVTSCAHRLAGGVTNLQEFQRVCRLFLARPLMVHGEDAPEVLRRIADAWNGWTRKGRQSQSAVI